MRLLLSLALTVSLAAACAPDDSSATRQGGAGGKADQLFSCPANPTLNSATGSQRRCIDADNGQFVATACCAEICEGADWQSQANGERCRWVHGAGLPGSMVGQFAPSMCCELNDSLECASASLVGGQCQSAEGQLVDSVCCQQEPITCHPAVAAQLRSCVESTLADLASDNEALPIPESEALALCTSEGDLMGPMLDALCLDDPDGFCNLDFEDFALEFVAACGQDIGPEFSCVFGHTFRDLFDSRNIVIGDDMRLQHAQAVQALNASEKAQVIIALHQSSHTDVTTLAQAFAAMDQGELRVIRFWEGSHGRAYQAFEYGAGDNSFGAIFDMAAGGLAARIIDGDIYDKSSSSTLGCDIAMGPGWRLCGQDADCEGTQRCQGRIDEHPATSSLGKCVNSLLGQGVPQNGNDCQTRADCPIEDGLVCGGMTIVGSGFCRPAWMFAGFEDAQSVAIPDGGTLERDIFVYGLANVPEDATIVLDIEHADVSQLDITVIPAMRDQGSLATVFTGATDASNGQTSLHIDGRLMTPGDEDLNGRWTLVIKDNSPGGTGVLHGWSLDFSSRFD